MNRDTHWRNGLANAFWMRVGRWGGVHVWRICLREIDPEQANFPEPPAGFARYGLC